MGTNYYATVGGTGEPIHIGKSSHGWVFALVCYRVDGDESGRIGFASRPSIESALQTTLLPRDWPEWKSFLSLDNGVLIRNQYGDYITPSAFFAIVEQREALPGHSLRRHLIDGVSCYGHGAGTWDELSPVFS